MTTLLVSLVAVPGGTAEQEQMHAGSTEKSLASLVFQPQEPELKGDGSMTTQAQLDREVACSRSYLLALQYIAEMVGMDTSHEPAEGVGSVVDAVDAFVRRHLHHGGARTLDDAKARCSENWINEQRLRASASPTAHGRAAAAYYVELEKSGA